MVLLEGMAADADIETTDEGLVESLEEEEGTTTEDEMTDEGITTEDDSGADGLTVAEGTLTVPLPRPDEYWLADATRELADWRPQILLRRPRT